MKKLFLAIIFATSILTTFAQDTTKLEKVYHNEFGIDATGFLKQFFNFNQGQFSEYYSAIYYLTYRRHFKCGNIRFAIGGDFANNDFSSSISTDSNKYHNNSYLLNSRIGWEFFNNLSHRWQVFYGIDFKPSVGYIKNDAPYWSGGYANGYEAKSRIYGIAPLLGFRFKLNNRLSFSTETSFSVNWQQDEKKYYYIPISNQYPPLPDEVLPKTIKIISSYFQPLTLFLTFEI